MIRNIREIGVFSVVLLGVIGIGFVLMVTGTILFLANCAEWEGRRCVEHGDLIPPPLADFPLTLIGVGLFFGGIVTLLVYREYVRESKP